MYKCIYCNSTDELTESDIISYALTGAKVTRRFVCKRHNSFTNDNFERATISRFAFFRNTLGLTERGGGTIKYSADVTIDGLTIRNYKVSDRASLYEDKKRLSKVEHDGAQHWIGSIEKLKQISGVEEDRIVPLDLSDVTISTSFVLEDLFASEEMLLTVAKTAYEWYCFIHGINEFLPEFFQNIVSVILKERAIEDIVQIIVDGPLISALDQLSEIGDHSLFSYTDAGGCEYVIFHFWGVVTYKIRIRSAEEICHNPTVEYDLYIYHLDGEKTQTRFATYGDTPHFIAVPADEAIKAFRKGYVSRLEKIIKTRVLTLQKLNSLVNKLRAALSDYKRTNRFERFVAYEEPERILALRLTSWLHEHEQEYDYSKGFNENMRTILDCGDVFSIDIEEDKAYAKAMQELHNQGTLCKKVETDIEAFDRINSQIEK